MEKTHSLRRFLVIRVEIFGLVFLLALLAGLCVGCGDGTEPEPSPDSGVVGTGTKTGTSTGTCPIPGSSETSTPGLPPVQFLTTSMPVSCSAQVAVYPPLKSFTCSEMADNSWSLPSAMSPCCVFGTKDASTGYLDNPGVRCGAGGEGEGQYALCSTSGSFLGWICYDTFLLFGK